MQITPLQEYPGNKRGEFFLNWLSRRDKFRFLVEKGQICELLKIRAER